MIPYIGPNDLPKKYSVGRDKYGRQKDPVVCHCQSCRAEFQAFSVTARFCPDCRARRKRKPKTDPKVVRVIDIHPPGKCRVCPRVVPTNQLKRGCCSSTCINELIMRENKKV